MDAFPGYTYFDPTRQVLCAMQIIKDTTEVSTSAFDTVFPHNQDEKAIGLGPDGKDEDSVVGEE